MKQWDHGRDFPYRVTHPLGAKFEGTIRRDPIAKKEIVVAAFTGNSNSDRSLREDIVANVKAQDPDLLFFSGDQSYDHRAHTAAWLLFRSAVRRDRQGSPDDHDSRRPRRRPGQPLGRRRQGLQAAGRCRRRLHHAGRLREYGSASANRQPARSVRPDTIEQDITVYYTSLNVGGIDFAIIEDRKFKTGPAGLVPQMGPRPDHINEPDYDRQCDRSCPRPVCSANVSSKFLHEWGQEWDGVEMKAVLSQTIFAGGAHIHGSHKSRLIADLDSNGWPQSGRARALEEIRRCFALHIAGDQHLATVIHHGINHWEDSCYSFCVPSIVNYYGRWWWPLEEPLNHDDRERRCRSRVATTTA